MANEAVLVIETELPIPLTCAEATGIAKGAILKLADLGTVSLADGTTADVVGGIAGSEKIADDGMVRIDVYRGGIFRGIASGSITTGDALGTYGEGATNYIYSITGLQTLATSGSRILGNAWEDATDEETFLFELNPQVAVEVA